MEFKIKEIEGKLVTESRIVADMIDKRHADLMRDIRGYISVLDPDADLHSADFFIDAQYADGNGQMRPCYLLTKKDVRWSLIN